MKKRMIMLLLAALVGMLSGCGSQKEAEGEKTTVSEEKKDTQEEKNAQGDVEENAISNSEDSTDSGNPDIYGVCTSIPKADVEAFAARVKSQILKQDLAGLSENIAYPITVGKTEYASAQEFKKGDIKFSQDFLDGLEKESCRDMFCNWQGISLGDGKVWISEVLNEDLSSQGIKITAINCE